LVLEEPVAEIDCQVNLVWLGNIEEILVLVHVEGHELITNLRGVFSRIDEAELS